MLEATGERGGRRFPFGRGPTRKPRGGRYSAWQGGLGAALAALEEGLGDGEALDLVGAGEALGDLGVAGLATIPPQAQDETANAGQDAEEVEHLYRTARPPVSECRPVCGPSIPRLSPLGGSVAILMMAQ